MSIDCVLFENFKPISDDDDDDDVLQDEYDKNIKIDLELIEGRTKAARLATIEKIESNWKKYIEQSKRFRKNHYDNPDNAATYVRDVGGTFDEPYKLHLKYFDFDINNRFFK